MRYFKIYCLVGALITTNANAQNLLEAGKYKLFETKGDLTRIVDEPQKHILHKYERAIPNEAGVKYAIIANDGQMNKILFITGDSFEQDRNQNHAFCHAYATPNWNYYSDDMPFCRTSIGSNDAQFQHTNIGFMFSFPDVKKEENGTIVEAKRKPTPEEIGACAVSGVCAKEAYGYYINNETIIHYSDSFRPVSLQKYKDIIYLSKDTKAYLSAGFKDKDIIKAKSFVALRQMNDNFIDVDYFSNDGSSKNYKILRDDLIKGEWIEQKARTNKFKFKIAIDEGVTANALKIIDAKTGKTIQSFYDIDSELAFDKPNDAIHLVDINFDGYKDISLFRMSGGAGPNSTENIWIYNPKTGKFIYDQKLSDFTQLFVDKKKKTIMTAFRNGCCDHSSETYKYINGKLTLVASWHEYLEGNKLTTTNGKLVKGKMIYKTTKSIAEY